MMKSMRLLAGTAVLVLGVAAGQAFAGPVGDTGSFTWTRQPGFFANDGGEFTLSNLVGISNSDYAVTSKDIGGILGSFQTFCIERNENAASPSYFVVGSSAIGGGNGGPSPDPISQGTAWLYSQFAQGLLNVPQVPAVTGPGNYFSAAPPSRVSEAEALQNAIWALEEETPQFGSVTSLNNAYYAAAVAMFGANATANASVGQFGVYVLNNYSNQDRTTKAQDFLYYHVPDGGTTSLLLGTALAGLGLIRRRAGR